VLAVLNIADCDCTAALCPAQVSLTRAAFHCFGLALPLMKTETMSNWDAVIYTPRQVWALFKFFPNVFIHFHSCLMRALIFSAAPLAGNPKACAS